MKYRNNLRNRKKVKFAHSPLTLFTTLVSCRVAGVIALSRLARASFKFLFCEGEKTLRKIKGAVTRNRCLSARVKEKIGGDPGGRGGKRARSCDIAKLRGGGWDSPCRSLEEALTNDGGNFYYFRCRPIRRASGYGLTSRGVDWMCFTYIL